MSSRTHSPTNPTADSENYQHVTPVKDKRSSSVHNIRNSVLQKRENLPDIHMTPNTSRTNANNDDKQGKDYAIAKVRSQNEILKRQVKDLNSKLTSALISSTTKKVRPKTEAEQNLAEEILRKQLQNAYKQMDNLKKQLQMFTGNPEGIDYYEKINKLENLVAEKTTKLEEILIEKKVLERINREQDRELETYKNTMGYEKKINSYMDEIRGLREKINNMQAINRHNEQSFKKQQEHVVSMTRQYRLVCDKIGIASNSSFSRPEDLDKILARRKTVRAPEDIAQDFEEAYVLKKVSLKQDRNNSFTMKDRSFKRTPSVPTIQNIKECCEAAEDGVFDEKYKKEIEKLNTRLYLLKSENRQMKSQLKEHEKKIISTKANPNDVRKSIIKHRSLSRINLTKNSDTHRASLTYSNIDSSVVPSKSELDFETDHTKYIPAKATESMSSLDIKEEPVQQVQQTQPVQSTQSTQPEKKPLLIVRKVAGGRIESGLSEFNDKEYLPTPLTSKITKLMVWSDESFIYGIQAFYKVQDTYYVAGEEHLGLEMKKKAKFVSTIELETDDQIWWIAGKYGEGITYLKIKTVKGHIKEFGTDSVSSNEFKMTLEPNENMTLLHGAFYYKKGDENTEDSIVLANIGFTLVKETTRK